MSINQNQYIILDIEKNLNKENNICISYAILSDNSLVDTRKYSFDSVLSESVLIELLPLLNNHIVIIYDKYQFDMLNQCLNESGYNSFHGRMLDVSQTIPILFPSTTNNELNKLAELYLLSPLDREEQQIDKVKLVSTMFLYLHQHILNFPLLLIQRLLDVYNSVEDVTIRTYLLAIENEKMNLLDSTLLANDVVSFLQMILKKKTIVELDRTTKHPDFLLDFFTRNDSENIFSDFEIRPQQQKMLELVHRALLEEKHLLVEAGTGTGKTLAYLLPLLYFSIVKEQRVIVATNTILLQKQIFERDIPLLKKIYNIPFNVVLIKGRSHYLCVRKLSYILSNRTLANSNDFLAKILVWLSQTNTGEGEELDTITKKDWNLISSDSETCLNKKCTCFSYCFYHFAKEKAAHANIIITNHSLIFSDIKSDHQILPAYNHIVFDEAHHLENEATKHLGIEIQYYDIKQKLNYLYKDNKNGAIPKAKDYLKLLSNQGIENSADIIDMVDDLSKNIIEFKDIFDECIVSIYKWLKDSFNDKNGINDSIRFDAKIRNVFPYNHLILNITALLKLIIKKMSSIENVLKNHDEFDYQASEYISNITSQKKSLQQLESDIHFFFSVENEEYVYWIDSNTSTTNIKLTLYAVPINVGLLLSEKLFTKKSCCILTSATLAIRGSFKYTTKRLGLFQHSSEDSLLTLALDSPFNYENQCLVCIPTDIPLIRSEEKYIATVSDLIAQIVIETHGKTLLLFTSNRLLTSFYFALKDKIENTDIKLLGQNIDNSSRSKLIEQFIEFDKAILLGSNSFWEGVDMPGNIVTNVFIMKLPFWPPTMPIIEARTELLEKQNINSFIEYSVPEAIIRFKQGFGRLIRTKTDKGTVVIFDRRIIDSKYGSYFIKALPNPTIKIVEKSKLLHEIREWNK